MVRPLRRLLLHSSLSASKPAPFRLLPSAAAAVSGGGGGTIGGVLEIVGPVHLLFPSSEARLYVRLLRRCARAQSAHAAGGGAVHSHVLKRGFASDMLVSNVLLDTYAKGGALGSCRDLFDEMPQRDVASWCTVIAAHVARGLCFEAIRLFKELLLLSGGSLRPNRFVISSVLNACAGSGVVELGLMVHGLVVKSGLGVDRFVEVGFVSLYAKCGNVGYAIRLFDEIPVKCSVAWNAMISGYVDNGCYVEAAELFRDMHRMGMAMHVVTLRVVSRVATVLGMIELCNNIHVYALKVGLARDCFMVAELIKLAGKVGDIQYMGKLFTAVKKRDASLYSLAISGYRSNGCRGVAVKLAEELLRSGLSVREGDLVSVLNLCLVKEEVKQVHGHVLKSGCFSYVNVSNILISIYSELGEMTDAESIFQKMQAQDVVSWTAVMAGFVQNLQFEKALASFKELGNSRIPIDQHCMATVINTCTGLQDMDKGKQIHSLVIKQGQLLVDSINASLVNMYAKCQCIEDAAQLFSRSLHPRNLVLTNAMLSGYCWNFLPQKALQLFCSEHQSGLSPDHFTYSTILGACADTGSKDAGEQVHCCLVKSGFDYFDVILGNAIIDLYIKCGCIASACKFFHSMRSCNTNSYTMLMLGYIQNRCSGEALRLYSKMQRSGLHANPVTFARILRGCADLSAIDLGRQLHGSIIKMGLISDVYVEHALVGMYRKSEGRNKSRRISQESLAGDVTVRNSMNNDYSEGKDTESTLEAIGLFKLEKAKDRDDFSDVQNLYKSAASQIYGTPLSMHVVEHDLKLDCIVENEMNNKYKDRTLLLNIKNAEHQDKGGGSIKLFNLAQENKISLDQIVLIVFSDDCHLKRRDASIANRQLMRSSRNALSLGMLP